MNNGKIGTLKSQVEYCLKKYPNTRNSDKLLTITVWREFYGELMGEDGSVYFEDILELPSEDNVRRFRAWFQNRDRLYPPTDWKVAAKRRWAEDDWKVALEYGIKGGCE